MRDEVGVLIRLTYLVSNPFLRRMLSFSDSRPAPLLQQPEQYIGPTSFLASWAFLVENTWLGKHGNRASSSNTSESQFIRSDLAVIPFKLTMIRSPESPRLFPIS